MGEYRVNLDIYNGPLDLLLYLIRREEVDIYDIPIARIAEQYVAYVEVLKQIDPDLAGDFLVLAATLMETKTRMMLPTPPPEGAAAEGIEIDPRAELVRQLLEYKTFKDAAEDLRGAAATQAMKFARAPSAAGQSDESLDLEDVQVWDLLDAFSKLMSAIGQGAGDATVIYDDTPVELHEADILDRLQREGPLRFVDVFAGRTERLEIVGLFLALLELIRLRKIVATQRKNFGTIHVKLNPEPPDEQPAGEPAAAAERAAPGAADAGQYVSDRTDEDDDDDARTEDQGVPL